MSKTKNTHSRKSTLKNKKRFKELEAKPHADLSQPPSRRADLINVDSIEKDAKKRSSKKPFWEKILTVIKGDKPSYKELVMNVEPLETRVALLVDGILEKFTIERRKQKRGVGSIFKGKIQNLEPGLKAAFVDIGRDKNAFLHYWDILPAKDTSYEMVRDNSRKGSKPKIRMEDIPNEYPVGTDIVVQITKDTIGSKGPRITTNIALPGRFIVLMPYGGQCGVSRKIESKLERKRLKKIIQELTIPEGMGLIIRTAGEGKKARYFVRDLHILINEWNAIANNLAVARQTSCIYQEPDLVERSIRDFLTEDIDRVLIDNQEHFDRTQTLVEKISHRSKKKIQLFNQPIPIFERFNIEKQIHQTFMRQVPLPSGGELVFDETEALVAIDINTGGHKNKNQDSRDYIVNVNVEAAIEIARQIRLRNIGGLIIIDFIDMKNRRDRNTVFQVMKQQMHNDKARNHILAISPLGIMQMTRQRHEESNAATMYQECPYCHGSCIIKSSETVSIEIQRSLFSVLSHYRNQVATTPDDQAFAVKILLHPSNLEYLRDNDEDHLIDIEERFSVQLLFQPDPNYHIENFRILNSETGREML